MSQFQIKEDKLCGTHDVSDNNIVSLVEVLKTIQAVILLFCIVIVQLISRSSYRLEWKLVHFIAQILQELDVSLTNFHRLHIEGVEQVGDH